MNPTLNWFCSATARRAVELRRQVIKLLNAQRDLLPPDRLEPVEAHLAKLDEAIQAGAGRDALSEQMAALETAANENLLHPSNPGMSDNIEQMFVGAAVILAVTTFFVQLFKIPTGSMQPTLYGILAQPLGNSRGPEIPDRLHRFYEYWAHGISYYDEKAEGEGEIEQINDPKTIFPFIKFQKFLQGGKWHTIWFPPEGLEKHLRREVGHVFRPGESILKLKITSGDHLLVDRFSYNFFPLKRGQIIVFKTRGIPGLQQDVLYIKRLVGLPGEVLRIGNDRHLVVNGRRLDASTPHFENVYAFAGRPMESHYSGHLNDSVARRCGMPGLAPLFPDEQTEIQIGPRHLMAMGDNTLNSLDSRTWGDFTEENLIGKFWFVYWPISPRFGWAPR